MTFSFTKHLKLLILAILCNPPSPLTSITSSFTYALPRLGVTKSPSPETPENSTTSDKITQLWTGLAPLFVIFVLLLLLVLLGLLLLGLACYKRYFSEDNRRVSSSSSSKKEKPNEQSRSHKSTLNKRKKRKNKDREKKAGLKKGAKKFGAKGGGSNYGGGVTLEKGPSAGSKVMAAKGGSVGGGGGKQTSSAVTKEHNINFYTKFLKSLTTVHSISNYME